MVIFFSSLFKRAAMRVMTAVVLAAALAGTVSAPAPVRADSTITVDTTDGGLVDGGGAGDCSLAEAITNANDNAATYADCGGGSAADTIDFHANLINATILLSASLPDITDANGLIIDGDLRITVSGQDSVRILTVSAPVTFIEMKINDGKDAAGNGGGVKVEASGNLTLDDSVFYSNEAVDGAGIYNAGTLNILESTFTSNKASSQGKGCLAFRA